MLDDALDGVAPDPLGQLRRAQEQVVRLAEEANAARAGCCRALVQRDLALLGVLVVFVVACVLLLA